MKTTIIYASIHHGNTEKVAKAIGSVLNAKPIPFHQVKKEAVLDSDLIGFGSGIYLAKFHKGLLKFVDDLPKVDNKKAFLFSTAGMKENIFANRGHRDMRKRLQRKGFEIVGEFDCKGYDTYSLLKLIGGLNKGRPDEKDLENARDFAKQMLDSV